ncbi:hypothetical protein MKO06_06235 [Gramella sp. GC03-9]|uniref:Uncharacterized protein n=1 Tax=Christiangramia oceanisediminis TaxID=2920386 RepID=A0A9X2I1Y5_9FLAO|nr:hypothetical protein [Gramella oceanisediminis]MCP9199496.1 hypothetical protein [Gramella oceanisediminis]
MKKFIIFLSIFSIFSCRTEQDAEESAEKAMDTTAFQASLKIDDQPISLQPEARDQALKWVEFITAQNEINKLENANVNQLMNDAGAIAQIMESLSNSIPDSLRSVAVEARLNVVNTKAQLLKQYSMKQEPDAGKIAETGSELYTEFNNFKLQLNEIFLKSIEDFEAELDEFEEMERQMDSAARIQNQQPTQNIN